jgi:hypothetical protein
MNGELASGRATNVKWSAKRAAPQYANDCTLFESNGLEPVDDGGLELDARHPNIDANLDLSEETENHFQ